MYKSIKLNKDYWGRLFPSLKYVVPNPLQVFSEDEEKFSKAMKSFKIGRVNKNTRSERHSETQFFLKEWGKNTHQAPIILDIGASDGVTSLELMETINNSFKKYYVTDYNIKCSYLFYKGYTYFFNQSDNCFLIASNKFVFYPANKWFFDLLFKNKIKKIKKMPRRELLMINKNLQKKSKADPRIEIMPYNVFEKWPKEKADIVIVGNLLHEVYFTEAEIKKGIMNCYNAMAENAILIIIRNVDTKSGIEIEKSTMYQKNNTTNKLDKIYEINGGVEINDFLLSINFSKIS